MRSLILALVVFSFQARANEKPWLDKAQTVEARTKALVSAMTMEEKLRLVAGYFSHEAPAKGDPRPFGGLTNSAGYVPGTPRLSVPALFETDAGLGVASTAGGKVRGRTALPSGLATAATFNPTLAYAAGKMIGNEARLSGFNVLLAGGANLLREPRNGRNFEYSGEDPLLAGLTVGQLIRGIQSESVLSTIKHFALNDQETDRIGINVEIRDAAARLSDLLAFELAIEVGEPGSVMCAYNRYHGDFACESPELLNGILKGDWAYKGFVMSDWGACHSTIPAARAGLDQESGSQFDRSPYFLGALQEAVTDGHVPVSRFDDMVTRILRQMFAKGLFDNPVSGDHSDQIEFAAHARVTAEVAEEGIVLLKNSGALPLKKDTAKIALIGGHADRGVLSGGGSSQVYPVDGKIDFKEGPPSFPGPRIYYPSSPMKELAARVSGKVQFNSGKDLGAAAKLAAESDVAIVFVTQWMTESIDAPNLQLPDGQNALIEAVAMANPRTIVILETGNPVTMPWLDKVPAVVEAWYPGTSGGLALAKILVGEINPSGHLPVTFPTGEAQLPRPVLAAKAERPTVDYNLEGAAVGYKWFDRQSLKPLFPFGHGLSYTSFVYSDLRVAASGGKVVVKVAIRNTGAVAGKAVAQIFAAPETARQWESPRRLVGYLKVDLKPGESKVGEVNVDRRLLSLFDVAHRKWNLKAGRYKFTVGSSAADQPVTSVVRIP